MFFRVIRTGMTGLGIVLIVTGLGIVFGKPQLEIFLRNAIQEEMSAAFDSTVIVEDVTVSLLRRALILENASVTNPQPFRDKPAIECQRIVIKAEPASLLTGTPLIHLIDVRGAEVEYRYKAGGGTNIARLSEALDRYLEQARSTREYRVALLKSEEANVRFSTNLLPLAKVGMRVVNVRVENLHAQDAVTGSQIANVFLKSVMREVITLKGLADPVYDGVQKLFGGEDSSN